MTNVKKHRVTFTIPHPLYTDLCDAAAREYIPVTSALILATKMWVYNGSMTTAAVFHQKPSIADRSVFSGSAPRSHKATDPEAEARRQERWRCQDEERRVKAMRLASRKAQEFHAAIVQRMLEKYLPIGQRCYPARDGAENICLTPLKFYVGDADRIGGEFINIPCGPYAFRRWPEDTDANPIDAAMVEGCGVLKICENHAYKDWLLAERGVEIPVDNTRGVLDRLSDMFGEKVVDGIHTRLEPNMGTPQFKGPHGHWVNYRGDNMRSAYDEEARRVMVYERSLTGSHA